MKYPYIVNKDGVWYPAGAEVPEGTKPVVEDKKVEVKQEVVSTPKVEEIEYTPKYTKTEINRMPLEELKALATEKGIDGANDMTGGELKKLLIEMFDL